MASESLCMPPVGTFTETNDGNVFHFRGDQSVKRWDGFLGDYVDAGVPVPGSAVTSASVGGDSYIVGIYYAYLRFLDSRGKVSNLSPVSNKLIMGGVRYGVCTSIEEWAEPTAYVTSASHGLTTGALIRITGGRSDHFNGEFRVGATTQNTFEIWLQLTPYDEFDIDIRTRQRYQGGATWLEIGNAIQYSDVEVPTDSRVVTRQILRNKDGNVNTFYVDIEDTDLTATTFTSTNADINLGEEIPLLANDGTDLNISRHSEPPDFKRVAVHHYSRIFAAKNLDYREGSVGVINSAEGPNSEVPSQTDQSLIVTGIGTKWTSAMAGRSLLINAPDGATKYTIASVDADEQTLQIETPYSGETSSAVSYSISAPDSEKLTLHFSEPGLPESWARDKVLTLTDDPHSGDLVGLMPMGPRLFILFEHRTQSLAYASAPDLDGQVSFSSARGCVNQRCWIRDGSTAYLMDQRGVYAFNGNQTKDLTSQIQGFFTGNDEFSISWGNSDLFHASHDPSTRSIRWFVSLGSSKVRFALAFNYGTQGWWLEEYSEPITASTLAHVDGFQKAIWGGPVHRVLKSETGAVDGLPTGKTAARGSVSSARSTVLSDNNAVFIPEYAGSPVCIIEGRGKGQVRTIVRSDGHELEIDRPFSILPAAGSVYQVGGFKWKYKTPVIRWAPVGSKKAIRSVSLRFSPSSAESTLVARRYEDFSSTASTLSYTRTSEEGDGVSTEEGSGDMVIDTTDSLGFVSQAIDSTSSPRTRRGRSVRFELEGTTSTDRHKIYEIIVEGANQQ